MFITFLHKLYKHKSYNPRPSLEQYRRVMIMLTAHLKKYGMKRCPIDNSIQMIGRKFTLHILRNMILLKQKRFSQFLGSIEGIRYKDTFHSIK